MHTRIAAFLLALLQTISTSVFKRELPRAFSVDGETAYQTFEGFGTSSCWWAQTIDNEDRAREIAKLLYDDDEGLGLDIFRYNLGGGEKDNPATRIGAVERRTESFYVFNKETGKYEFDFTRDKNARRMLDLAVEYGATKVVLFCNSPHFSMTLSGHASGGLEPNVSNLPRENYRAFVDYVLTIADWFVEQGYPVSAISPINEPQWGWGGDWVGQEGCHYTADETVELLELFAVTMKERNSPYKLNGPESGEMSDKFYEYSDKFFASEILNGFCDTFSGHSYWMDKNIEGKRASGEYFREKYPDKKYEMSEWCELPHTIDPTTIESGLYMANVIVPDFTLMNAVSWQSWTAVNGDGLMEQKDGELVTYKRYYAFKQFSAFVKAGMKRFAVYDSGGKSSISAVAFGNGEKTVLILVNNAPEEQQIRITGHYTGMKTYVTDAQRNCEKSGGNKFMKKNTLPALSISTFVLD